MTEDRIYYLLRAYTGRTATIAEEQELFHWVARADQDAVLKDYIRHLMETEAGEKFPDVNWDNLRREILRQARNTKHRRPTLIMRRYKIAAAIVALLIAGSFYLISNKKQYNKNIAHATKFIKNDIKPGGTKAILQAGNSRVILNKEDTSFTLAGNTVQINNGGVKIADKEPVQYTLITPPGGEYRLVLSDGTTVWLNADSKLIYPSVFTGNNRQVALGGEAYFEVKTDASHPFTVKLSPSSGGEGRGEVKVLGTHFNVNAYPDDPDIITTLISGKVQVKSKNNQMILQAGEQTVLNKTGNITLNKAADIEQAIAWKNGYFRFDKADIHTIMKQLARWYDIKVTYENELPAHYFGAIISRDNNISGILNMLEATGEVHFKINGNEVTVSK